MRHDIAWLQIPYNLATVPCFSNNALSSCKAMPDPPYFRYAQFLLTVSIDLKHVHVSVYVNLSTTHNPPGVF